MRKSGCYFYVQNLEFLSGEPVPRCDNENERHVEGTFRDRIKTTSKSYDPTLCESEDATMMCKSWNFFPGEPSPTKEKGTQAAATGNGLF